MQIIYLEISDLSQAVGVSESKVRRRVKLGQITPSARTVRGDALFTSADAQRVREILKLEAAQRLCKDTA